MVQAFVGDPFLAKEALVEEARLLAVEHHMIAPDIGALDQALSGGLFGACSAVIDMRDLGEGAWKNLRLRLEQVDSSDIVLIYDPKPTAPRTKWYKEQNAVQYRPYPLPEKKDLTNWVINRGKRHGLKLSGAVGSFFANALSAKGGADSVPVSLEGVEQELKKLALLPQPVSLEKVRDVVALEVPISAFDLTKALSERHQATAFGLLSDMLHTGEDPMRILGALTWQYTRLARIAFKLHEDPQVSEAVIAAELQLHPFVAKQNTQLAKKMGLSSCHKAIQLLITAEQRSKTGQQRQLALEAVLLGLLSV